MGVRRDQYKDFLATWILIPESCRYEQGEAPRSGSYRIEERDDGQLVFALEWTDAEGKTHEVTFAGAPDGQRQPFEGGNLADALSVSAISPRELRSSAFYRGKECMVAQRQLDATGQAMRVVQVVRFDNGTSLSNVAVYRRAVIQ